MRAGLSGLSVPVRAWRAPSCYVPGCLTTGTARRSPMSEYAQEAAEAFAQARACYEETEQWLGSAEAAALAHAELEDQLGVRGRELLRRLFQGQMELRALREQRRDDVTGADGVARTPVEKGHAPPPATVFGQVAVTRMAYRAPGARNVHPL